MSYWLSSPIASAQNVEFEGIIERDSLLSSTDVLEEGGFGLVLDNSRTKVGRDFYELFYQKWNAGQLDSTQVLNLKAFDLEDLTITIEELPSPGIANIIQVSVNDQLLWQQFVQPRLEAIEFLVENAFETILQYIVNYQEIQNQLGSQDQKGTGIY